MTMRPPYQNTTIHCNTHQQTLTLQPLPVNCLFVLLHETTLSVTSGENIGDLLLPTIATRPMMTEK